MARHCTTCDKPVEEVFDIPWLGKFYLCDDGHVEVHEPEGGRMLDEEQAVEPLRSCRRYVDKFVPKARSRDVGKSAAPIRA